MDDLTINKVSESGLITLDLEDYYPKEDLMMFDLKDFLFMELILKEKDYRAALKNYNFSVFNNKYTSIFCSVDAVIPMWAFMLASVYIQPFAKDVFFGNEQSLKEKVFLNNLEAINTMDFLDKRVVIKGCGELPISENAYVLISKLLRPVVKSIMYGEPCSTVPIFKQSKPL